jgi:hypothetical protein
MIRGFLLTLTDADTNYNLHTLAVAIESTLRTNFSQISLQPIPANTGLVLIGDEALSGTRYGLVLGTVTSPAAAPAVVLRSGSGGADQSLKSLYARSAAAGQKIAVLLEN